MVVYGDLADTLNEDDGGAADAGVSITTSSNIAYLPGGFTTVSKSLQGLAKKKKDWDIEVLENGDDYDVNFDKELGVKVKKEHWPEFLSHTKESLGDFAKVRKVRGADLGHFLKEAIQEEVDILLGELREALLDKLKVSEVRNASMCASYWESVIKPTYIAKDPRAAFGYNTMVADVDGLIKEAAKEYAGDVGGLQELIHKIQENKSLSGVDIFKKYPFLFSVNMVSGRKGGKIVFEATVDIRGNKFISVITKDKELLERLSELPGMRFFGLRKMVAPKGGIFSRRDVESIKECIDTEDLK
jgi:hypothetical protein